MIPSEQFRYEIAYLDDQILLMRAKRDGLYARLLEQESRLFVLDQAITKEDVWDASAKEVPFFLNINSFVAWIERQPETRSWFSWNGTLHNYLKFQEGDSQWEISARFEHVPEGG